ncbi:MAG: ABC transporter substrate-binding protein [bacterium]|nr:ABC transporter substrate-binding protein [bacterium]
MRNSRWRHYVGTTLFALGLFLSSVGHAEPKRPFRIGSLTESWGPQPSLVGLREGLKVLDYKENQDFAIGVRFTQGNLAALPAAARQMVNYGVDLLFVSQPTAARAAQQATNQIPIVFAGVGDPVGQGLVESFAHPGGNMTGVVDLNLELIPKRLQVFHQMVPDLDCVLFLYDANDDYGVKEAQMFRETAQRLGLKLIERPVHTEAEAQLVLSQLHHNRVDGILAPRNVSLNIPGSISTAATQLKTPTMFNTIFWVQNGALASYGPDFYETGRQTARLVDKIIKGAKPADIPVEVNSKIEFVINLKVAKALGLTISPEVLYQADLVLR